MNADGDDGQPVDTDLLARLGEGFLLIVGRMEGDRYKGHEDLLGALARLAPAYSGLRLVVVGEGSDRARLEARARELGVGDRAFFTGFVDAPTLAAIYRRCGVFAMPSSDEGFGLVYLEAMRAGKPCIALAGSAAAEIVVDGETGRLVQPGTDALTHALRELLTEQATRATMGRAGQERWRRLFRLEHFAKGFQAHLDALCETGR
jgi:glycosyltransferase involved in cell wall biosynthesis